MAQDLYSARGYWTEINKEAYQKILQKKRTGATLTDNEIAYVTDYEIYLENYFQRMSEDEKLKYNQMKAQWDQELTRPAQPSDEYDFELRPRDRITNGIYGAYYGASIAAIGEFDETAAIGVPLIIAGLWQLGPVLNPKKYEGITRGTIRAGNTGKFLGLGYGLALGLAIGGDSENTGKIALGLSSVASISLGEAAFQIQKKKQVSEGHIEMMRHYGVLGPAVAILGVAATNTDNANLAGASLVAGGITGLIIGNSVAKKYDYTVGDTDIISSLTWISTGIGFTGAAEVIDDDENLGLLLIPAATAIAGTVLGQRSVKGVYLTKKQGSTINLSSGGAALIGLGITALLETESPAVFIGVPSALALIMHQSLFHSYKMKNLESN
ncbi:MAG: hypothetical protein JNL53_16960, partial [Cyclobacteriaceae bacterium]|nr:hypothetical protein [Cyclobacteriaceae bacterium]